MMQNTPWIVPAAKAAYAAAREIYLYAQAANELNRAYHQTTGHDIGGYTLRDGANFRWSCFTSPKDFILFLQDPPMKVEA